MHNLEDALCAQTDPDAFFEEASPNAQVFALRLCTKCPLKKQCLDSALNTPYADDYGVWGGTTRAERRRMRTARNKQYRLLEGTNNVVHND